MLGLWYVERKPRIVGDTMQISKCRPNRHYGTVDDGYELEILRAVWGTTRRLHIRPMPSLANTAYKEKITFRFETTPAMLPNRRAGLYWERSWSQPIPTMNPHHLLWIRSLKKEWATARVGVSNSILQYHTYSEPFNSCSITCMART